MAAGDYVAGPSHCLPTNTTARFSSGISVYEFLKRTSVERYEAEGLRADAAAIIAMAEAEGLEGHARSVKVRSDQGLIGTLRREGRRREEFLATDENQMHMLC